MNRRFPLWSLAVLSALFLVGGNVLAQDRDAREVHFSGLLNDYTPSTVANGPYEMRGSWTLGLNLATGKANFFAEMNMETSDYGTATGVVDPKNPATRGAHTHHIAVTDADVTWNLTGCPAFSPAAKQGFQFTKTVSLITGNGSKAPFEKAATLQSVLQICVSGGSFGDPNGLPYTNMTMTFVPQASGAASPAASHFGSQAIHGVVNKVSREGDDER
jgi:hypothetical protein